MKTVFSLSFTYVGDCQVLANNNRDSSFTSLTLFFSRRSKATTTLLLLLQCFFYSSKPITSKLNLNQNVDVYGKLTMRTFQCWYSEVGTSVRERTSALLSGMNRFNKQIIILWLTCIIGKNCRYWIEIMNKTLRA